MNNIIVLDNKTRLILLNKQLIRVLKQPDVEIVGGWFASKESFIQCLEEEIEELQSDKIKMTPSEILLFINANRESIKEIERTKTFMA